MARGNVRVKITADNDQFKREVRDTEQSLGRLQKTSRVAGAGVRAGLTAGAAGAGVLAVGLLDSVKAAQEAEVSQKRLETQLRANGTSYRAHAAEIDKVIQKTSQLAGLDDEDLQDAFTNIVRVTGDVDKGLRLVGLAADFARAKHLDVAKAGEIVAKVAGGNTGILSRYGITIKEGATATEALGELQKRFAGQAEAYGKTSAGAQDRFRVATENLQESIGSKLLPILTRVQNEITSFIGGMQNGTGAGGRFADSMRKLGKDLGDVFDGIQPIVRKLLPGIRQQFQGIATMLKGAIEVISGILHGDFGKAWDGVKDIFRGGLKAAVGQLEAFTAPARAAGKAVGDAVYQGISAGFRSVVGFMEDRLNDVIGVINSAIGVFNKLPGPDIGKIPQIGGGGASRSEIVRALPTGRVPSTGRQLPHGTSSTGRSNFIAQAASVSGGSVARAASVPGGGFQAQAASVDGAPCVLTYYAPSRGGINGRAGGGAAGVPLYDESWACAAPPGYAFGTIIRFFYGGRSIDVPVLDRGSAIQGNHFDLLVAPARALGMLSAGKVNARFKVVGRQRQLSAASSGGGARAVAPSVPAVVAGGKFLQGRGLQVGESSHFGGVTTNRHKHYPNDHYSGRSIDVNFPGGGGAELTRLQSALGALKQRFGSAIDFAMIEDAGGGNQHLHVTFKNRSVAGAALGGLGRVAPRLTASLGRVVSSAVPPSQRRRQRADAAPGLAFGEALVASMNARAGLTGDVVADATDPGLAQQANTMRRFQIGVRLNAINARLSQFGVPLAERTALLNEQASLTGEAGQLNTAFTAPKTAGELPDDIALALAESGLTKGTGDDLVALKRQRSFLEERLAAARGTPTLKDDIEAVNALAPVISAIESLEGAVSENTQAMLDLEKQRTADLQRALNVSQSDYGVLTRALAAIVGGEIGGKLGLGWSTPGYAGAGARY